MKKLSNEIEGPMITNIDKMGGAIDKGDFS